jgi:DNA polymerase I-like protein with 3'-5' exonuclease and polymerase domains
MAVTIRVKRKPLFPHFTDNRIAFDTEGTGLIPFGSPSYWGYHPARPFAYSFCDGEGNTGYFRFAVDPATRRVIPEPEGMAILHRLMTEKHFQVIGHNVAYDFRMGKAMGEPIRHTNALDTMVLAHVVTGGDELTYALKPLSQKYLEFSDDDERQLEHEVNIARREARDRGWLIAIGSKELAKGQHGVFAGRKPVKADYWLVPSPDTRELPNDSNIDVDDPDIDKTKRYAVGDVLRAQMLAQLWMPVVEADQRLLNTFNREMALFWALRRMETHGTRAYPEHIDKLIAWYERYMVKMRKLAHKHGGKGMNFMSAKQLAIKFYDERKVTPVYYTPKGQQLMDVAAELRKLEPEDPFEVQPMATIHIRKNKQLIPLDLTADEIVQRVNKLHRTLGKDQLAELGGTDEDTGEYKDPLAKAILEWRAAKQTIKSFLNIYRTFYYPETFPGGIRPAKERGHFINDEGELQSWASVWGSETWVLHPNYNQTGAVTGRMTCSDPNLQQVASATTGLRKADIPARPRECFGPRPGCLWYLPDYSQIEVWLFAFMSGEEAMQKLLLSGHDFHQGVADKSFVRRPDYEERKKYYRKLAKLIMFGKLYGGGVGTPERPGRMTKLLQQPFEETKAFIDSFEEQFASVGIFSKKLIKEIRKTNDLWNPFGRRYVLGHEWAYKGVNYLIQGTAADILKRATIRLDYLLYSDRWRHPQLALVNSIHDEFIIEVPFELHSQRLMREIIYVMQMDSAAVGVPVPLPVGMKIATKRWSTTKDIELAKWMTGGVPRDDGPFDDLRRDMQACPH